jgi:hypothetical protein
MAAHRTMPNALLPALPYIPVPPQRQAPGPANHTSATPSGYGANEPRRPGHDRARPARLGNEDP